MKPWNKNLTKETDERIKNYGIKGSKNRKNKCMGDENPAKRIEVRKKISDKLKNRILTNEWKEKIRNTLKGRKQTEETKIKRRETMNRPEIKERLRKAKKGNTYRKGKKVKDTSKMREAAKNRPPVTEKTKRKMREAAIKYAEKTVGIICPRIGKNEKRILDKLEQKLNYKIDRMFTIEGYFPDGYIHELNLIIEVDERPKIREKDIEREKIIKKALNCKFLRIKDYG